MRPDPGPAHFSGGGPGKLLSPARRRHGIDRVCGRLKVSERRICRVLSQHRSTQRHVPRGQADEARLVVDRIEFSRQYGRDGDRRIAALLRDVGRSMTSGLSACGDVRG